MKSLLTLSVLLLSAPVVFAQQITNVTTTPSPLLACVPMSFNIIGTAPPGMSFTFINSSITETTIGLVIEASGPASGSSSFNNPVTSGPFGEGEYAVTISLEYNGTITSTWTGNLTVLPPIIPNVGEANTITVCPNDAPFSMTTRLNGNPDPGGIWLNPQLETMPGGMFVPGVSPPGGYQYYFNIPPPCETNYQSLVITYNENSSAGANATVSLCTESGAPAVELFPLLAGSPDAGGTWSGAGTSGVFIPGVSQPGAYVYTVPGIPPCTDPSATVTVVGATGEDAGTGGPALFCFDEEAANLNDYVTGEPNSGVWYAPDGSGIALYNDPVNVAAYGEGVYAYVVDAAPCPADTAYVTVTLDGPPCTIGIEELEPNGAKLMVMPNPASDHVTVEVERRKVTGEQSIVIMDVNGKVVLRKSLNSSGNSTKQTVDISTLVPGAYMIDLVGCGRTTAQRLMVR
ncbi:MAG: T9SS type A sorting domain-containing protein [Flavobacteriales bacterium]